VPTTCVRFGSWLVGECVGKNGVTMPDQDHSFVEFRISARRQGLLLLGMGLATLFFAFATVNSWGNWFVSGFMLSAALGLGLIAAVLAVTLVTRPVMVRVTSEGVFLQRLNATIPWDALSAIRTFRFRGEGNRMVELVEAEGGHEAFRQASVERGTTLSEMAGLPPPLVIDFARTQGSAEEFLAAVQAVGQGRLLKG